MLRSVLFHLNQHKEGDILRCLNLFLVFCNFLDHSWPLVGEPTLGECCLSALKSTLCHDLHCYVEGDQREEPIAGGVTLLVENNMNQGGLHLGSIFC